MIWSESKAIYIFLVEWSILNHTIIICQKGKQDEPE